MRNNALDAGKLTASFFIVTLHVGLFNEYPALVGEFIRTSARWAVPFFFLASGYLWGKSSELHTENKMNKALSILFYASLIYAVLRLTQLEYNPLRLAVDLLGFQLLKGGTYFHLWFMCSLILGFFVTGMLLKNKKETFLKIFAICIPLALWASDVSKAFGYHSDIFYFMRTMQSIAFIYFGYFIAQNEEKFSFKTTTSFSIITISLLLCGGEVYAFNSFYGADMIDRQFPLFSVGAAIGLLLVCINTNLKENRLSAMGAKYSLGIYLIHPVYLYYMGELLKHLDIKNSTLLLAGCFFLSALTMFLLEKMVPNFYKRLNGSGVQ